MAVGLEKPHLRVLDMSDEIVLQSNIVPSTIVKELGECGYVISRRTSTNHPQNAISIASSFGLTVIHMPAQNVLVWNG